MVDDTVRPPSLPGPLATWFSEAVREELIALEKSGGTQSYEVLSGSLLQTIGTATAIFQFIIADGTRIPEDANGRLKTSDADYVVSVLRQVGDRIDLQLEGTGPLPDFVPRGMLLVDDTALLRRLAPFRLLGLQQDQSFHQGRSRAGEKVHGSSAPFAGTALFFGERGQGLLPVWERGRRAGQELLMAAETGIKYFS